MLRSKRISATLVISFLTVGCATSTYKVLKQTGSLTEIVVSSNRVLVECEHQDGYVGDVKNPYGFMVHVLDEEKTVLTLIVQPVLSKRECFQQADAANKILKQSKTVHIGSFSPLYGLREKTGDLHTFPTLGTFEGNGHVLNYQTIWNEHGLCYDIYSGSKKPCPRIEFKSP